MMTSKTVCISLSCTLTSKSIKTMTFKSEVLSDHFTIPLTSKSNKTMTFKSEVLSDHFTIPLTSKSIKTMTLNRKSNLSRDKNEISIKVLKIKKKAVAMTKLQFFSSQNIKNY